MSESLKENMIVCFPLLSFGKEFESSGSKTTDGSEAPSKRAGGDGMMHVVVSCTRNLIKPRAQLFITSTESHNLNEHQRES